MGAAIISFWLNGWSSGGGTVTPPPDTAIVASPYTKIVLGSSGATKVKLTGS